MKVRKDKCMYYDFTIPIKIQLFVKIRFFLFLVLFWALNRLAQRFKKWYKSYWYFVEKCNNVWVWVCIRIINVGLLIVRY